MTPNVHLDRLLRVARGLAGAGRKIASAVPDSLCAGEEFASPETLAIIASDNCRWVGERDEVEEAHPVAIRLRRYLQRSEVPEPEARIVDGLRCIPGFDQEGALSFIDGVPIPTGLAQTSHFIVSRWRSLFSPTACIERIYQGDTVYDRLNTTDHLQEDCLSFSTRMYRDYLYALQLSAPRLFVDLWLRRFDGAGEEAVFHQERISGLLPAPLIDRLACLPEVALLLPAAMMSEFERVSEIAERMMLGNGITREAIDKARSEITSFEDILDRQDDLGRFLAGQLLSIRFNHPTMNKVAPSNRQDLVLEHLWASLDSALPMERRYRRVDAVGKKQPMSFMNGVELGKFVPVALEQMQDNLRRFLKNEGHVNLGEREHLRRRLKQMCLAVVITSSKCEQTARVMTGTLTRAQAGEGAKTSQARREDFNELPSASWRRIYPTAMILGPDGVGELYTLEDDLRYLAGKYTPQIEEVVERLESAFKYKTERVTNIAKECTSAVDEPGWTRGARFEAWLRPEAELAFLRDCSRHVQYDKKLDDEAKQWDRMIYPQQAAHGPTLPASPNPTVLPQPHPVAHVQQSFRPLFDRLQITNVIATVEMQRQSELREACIAEAARRFAAWSPFTTDLWLSEKINSRPKKRKKEVGKSSKRPRGELTALEVDLARKWSWNRDWQSCGTIGRY